MEKWTPQQNQKSLRRVGKLGEETTELAKVCFRILLQGSEGIDPGNQKPNRQALLEEISDVLAQTYLTIDHFGLDTNEIEKRMLDKISQMRQWEAMFGR